MIQNGYIIFALIELMLLLILIVGIILHIYVLINVKESIFYKYFLSSNLITLTTGIVTIIGGIIFYILLNVYNDNFKNDHMDCC